MEAFPITAFESDEQRATVCRILCEGASLPGMWTGAYGPTERALEHVKNGRGGLSLGQWAVFRAAWAIWDGSTPPRALTLRELLWALEGRHLAPIASLLVAVSQGPAGIREWCRRNDVGLMPRL